MDFANTTVLDSERLERLLLRHTAPYRHDRLIVRVRRSRGADFSGACYYATSRIFVNLGSRNQYPYLLATHIARSQSNATHWWRESFRVLVADAYLLVLFVYLHELFHYLVKAAGRNTRRKEAMCDRFATRVLVDAYGCPVLDARGRPAPRSRWDIQDLHAFVAAAPKTSDAPVRVARAARVARPIPVRILGAARGDKEAALKPRAPRAGLPDSRALQAGAKSLAESGQLLLPFWGDEV
ncbi:MAG: hypothetical protein IPM13_02135 [Phycisphaerales bacterium]|nr:hypothetical protein [Phycisphaerales bacterium]